MAVLRTALVGQVGGGCRPKWPRRAVLLAVKLVQPCLSPDGLARIAVEEDDQVGEELQRRAGAAGLRLLGPDLPDDPVDVVEVLEGDVHEVSGASGEPVGDAGVGHRRDERLAPGAVRAVMEGPRTFNQRPSRSM